MIPRPMNPTLNATAVSFVTLVELTLVEAVSGQF
jgi:hypothetical protein